MHHFTNLSEENYLKTLYKLESKSSIKVNNTALAKSLDLTPATVLEMVRKLGEKRLVEVLPDKTIRLTEKGKLRAIHIVRRHRLWEVFLVDKLKYKWDEVHDLAEQLEHIESDDLVKRLEAYLGFPSVDPHGDLIPDENGKLKRMKTLPLSTATPKTKVTIVTVLDTSNEFLNHMDRLGLTIGDSLQIAEIEDYDKSVTVIHKKNTITLSNVAASNILVAL